MKRTIKALSLTLFLSLGLSSTAFGGWFTSKTEPTIIEKGLSLVKSPWMGAFVITAICATALGLYATSGKKSEAKPNQAPEKTENKKDDAKKDEKQSFWSRFLNLFKPKSNKEAPKTEVKPTEVKPTEVKPTEVKPTEVKPTEVKPTEVKPTEVKPTEVKPVAPKTINQNNNKCENGSCLLKGGCQSCGCKNKKSGYSQKPHTSKETNDFNL